MSQALRVLALALLSPLALAEDAGNDNAQSVFEKTRPLVFQVKTAVSAEASKSAYGSGFALSPDGLLATNYHVISKAIDDPERYKIYVRVGEQELEAEIRAIQVVHDLAILKIDRNFSRYLSFAPELPRGGEKLFSVGIPQDLNLSVVEGNFNGNLQLGNYEQYVLSSPINPGMSGGPTLNSNGDLVGVNVAILRGAQNLSFAIPGYLLSQLMKSARDGAARRIASLKALTQSSVSFDSMKEIWREIIHGQLRTAQERLFKSWFGEPESQSIQFAGWKTLAPPKQLKCWREQQEAYNDHIEVDIQRCDSFFTANPEPNLQSARYEVSYIHAKNKTFPNFKYVAALNELYKGSLIESSTEDFVDRFRSGAQHFTQSQCRDSVIVNNHGISLLVAYCMRGLVNYPSLVDASVRVATVNSKGEDLMVLFKMKGFEAPKVKEAMNQLLESVEWTERSPASIVPVEVSPEGNP
jgi:serine protease Do